MIDGYYNRFNPAKEYDSHLFRAGYVLQSAEMNEIQSAVAYRVRGIGDALFKDGNVVRDARIIVNADTGVVTCESGAIYLSGAVRGVPTGSLTIATTGVVTVGIYIQSITVTEQDDPDLRDPATLTRNYMEPGAARNQLHTVWGYYGDNQDGDFYPVYTVEDGMLRAKEPPPNLDSVTQALARYDRDSAGGTYVVSGLGVKQLADLNTGEQVYSIEEGRARVNGYGVELSTSRRVVYDAVPDLQFINSEPHLSTTASAQRVDLDNTPAANITEVTITKEKTVTLTHGGFTGAEDPLPDNSVLELIDVHQGGTTYVINTEVKLTSGNVDWSLSGAEPAPGSTYSVTYRYITTATPTSVDATGFTVTGAVSGTLILVSYNQMLPRYDRLVLKADGSTAWVTGVAAEWSPRIPSVPVDMLSLATVYQTWSNTRTVANDSVRVVPMSELSLINSRFDYLLGLIAQGRLESDIYLREAGQKKGLFVDPFLDDNQRDAGTAQTAAIFDGELTLPVTISGVSLTSADITVRASLAYTHSVDVQQLSRTGSVKINPYMAFDPIPASVMLTPAVDHWTVINTTWASAITQRIIQFDPNWHGVNRFHILPVASQVQLLSSASRPAETLREIDVHFTITGFGPNEVLTSVTFDGIAVTASAP